MADVGRPTDYEALSALKGVKAYRGRLAVGRNNDTSKEISQLFRINASGVLVTLQQLFAPSLHGLRFQRKPLREIIELAGCRRHLFMPRIHIAFDRVCQ